MCGSSPPKPQIAPPRASAQNPTLPGLSRRVTGRINDATAFRNRNTVGPRADGSSLGLARLGATARTSGFTGEVVLGQAVT